MGDCQNMHTHTQATVWLIGRLRLQSETGNKLRSWFHFNKIAFAVHVSAFWEYIYSSFVNIIHEYIQHTFSLQSTLYVRSLGGREGWGGLPLLVSCVCLYKLLSLLVRSGPDPSEQHSHQPFHGMSVPCPGKLAQDLG